jgi:hypothetical protein
MPTIVVQPPELSLQGRPFVFQVSSDNDDQPYIKLVAEPVTGQKEYLNYGGSGFEVKFDLREYFKPELSVALSLVAAVHANACKQFSIKLSDYYGNPPTEQENTTVNKTVHIGTVPRWMLAAYDAAYANFAARLGVSPFMTWYPAQNKRVLPAQNELLYFVAPNGGNYSVSVNILFSDGTLATHTPAGTISLQAYQVGSFNVGYTALGLAAVSPSKTVVRYTVTLAGKTRTYDVDYKAYRDVRYIIFRNSLGGYDTLPCTGEADETTEVERQISESIYDAESSARYNKKVYQTEHFEKVKVNSGFLAANEKRWLNDLFISEEVFEIFNGIQTPILITANTLDRTERSYEPGSIEIEYERLSIIE